jgi:hypothetical protein
VFQVRSGNPVGDGSADGGCRGGDCVGEAGGFAVAAIGDFGKN